VQLLAIGGAQSIHEVKHVRGRTSVSQSLPASLEEGKGQESSGHVEVQSTFDEVTNAQPEQGSEAAVLTRCRSGLARFDHRRRENGKRESGAERRNGWLSGKSSEGSKPMDGSGAKQSHKASRGSSR
jgi:hypothetical protein